METLQDINEAWDTFCDDGSMIMPKKKTNIKKNAISKIIGIEDFHDMDNMEETSFVDNLQNIEDCSETKTHNAPKASKIYISTKTKIAYLNQNIDLKDMFWSIPILPYHLMFEGIVKKEMKFNSSSLDELNLLQTKCEENDSVHQHIITSIINPDGRIKFKDVRKISVGLSKKDIISYRRKKRGAFYNCFVTILRVRIDDTFKEIHVKVFNTGKLEIPGIQTEEMLHNVLKLLVEQLSPFIKSGEKLACTNDIPDTVLINSNFNSGYYIDREKLYKIIHTKYNINCAYDPCSYPGIQCEFYYDPALAVQNGVFTSTKTSSVTKVSFMIFRTGSVLIVGKCTEHVLDVIYKFLCSMLEKEYHNVGINFGKICVEDKSKKNRRKIKKTIYSIE